MGPAHPVLLALAIGVVGCTGGLWGWLQGVQRPLGISPGLYAPSPALLYILPKFTHLAIMYLDLPFFVKFVAKPPAMLSAASAQPGAHVQQHNLAAQPLQLIGSNSGSVQPRRACFTSQEHSGCQQAENVSPNWQHAGRLSAGMQSGVPWQLLQQVQHLRADSAMRSIGGINRWCLVENTADACVTTGSVKLGGNRQLQSTLHAPNAVPCHTSRRSAAYEGLCLKEKHKVVELEHVPGMECQAQHADLQEVTQRADQLSGKRQTQLEAGRAQKRIASEQRLLAAQHKQRADQVAEALQDTQIKLHGSEETCAALQVELCDKSLLTLSLSYSTLRMSRKHPKLQQEMAVQSREWSAQRAGG